MSIIVGEKIKPDTAGAYAIVDADDIAYKEGRLVDFIVQCVTEEEYNTLKEAGKINDKTPYLIIEG